MAIIASNVKSEVSYRCTCFNLAMAEILEEIRISAMYNPVKLGKIYLPGSDWIDTQLILMGDGHIFQISHGGETYNIFDIGSWYQRRCCTFFSKHPPPPLPTSNDERLNLIVSLLIEPSVYPHNYHSPWDSFVYLQTISLSE